jgi:hypothetical protein
MINLNIVANVGGNDLLDIVRSIKNEFNPPYYGVEMGIAWGGGVEDIGKIWKDCGTIYGYDTFEGHPKQLGNETTELTALDEWYMKFGTDTLSYEYQRAELDRQGLDNIVLVKGLINKDSCADIPYLHYALLDLDILESMQIGYEAVKHKLLPGGYLCIHDYGWMPLLTKWADRELLPCYEIHHQSGILLVLKC